MGGGGGAGADSAVHLNLSSLEDLLECGLLGTLKWVGVGRRSRRAVQPCQSSTTLHIYICTYIINVGSSAPVIRSSLAGTTHTHT